MKKIITILTLCLGALTITSCGEDTPTVEPGDPTEPNDPSDPGEPSDPTEPEDPVDPSDPTDPDDPEEPEDPVDPVIITYDISFYNETGTLLDTIECEENKVPVYTYNPTDTVEYDYTFEGWSLSLNGEKVSLAPATEDTSYYAIVSSKKQVYTITFETFEGSEVAPKSLEYGVTLNKEDISDPTLDGYRFVGWCLDSALQTAVTFPYKVEGNATFYAVYNERVDFKTYLNTLLAALGNSPLNYIPTGMSVNNQENYVTNSEITYDLTKFTNVSDIKYGGYGEQWTMVLTNINQSRTFYNVLTSLETVINSSVILFNNYFDQNTSNEADHDISEATYSAYVKFSNGVLEYTLALKTGLNVPLLGEVRPQIDLTYNIASNEKTVRINLTDTNVLKYVVTDNSYTFAISYGVNNALRRAYFEISEDSEGLTSGHIYEYIGTNESDLIKSCADFYFDDTYCTVVGNKASGMLGFSGYINELYLVDEGKLLGYEVRETQTIVGITGTYHTLWFNLNDISNINTVKVLEKTEETQSDNTQNPHEVYVNGSSTLFTPTYNYQLIVRTSRKYDIELRKQYFPVLVDENTVSLVETNIPMMFIQADHDDYTNFSDFPEDILDDNGIEASVTLNKTYLEKIQSDYATYIDIFIENKDKIDGVYITNFLGDVRA